MEGRRVFGELTVEENLRVGSYSNRAGLQGRLRRMFDLFPVLGERRTQSAGYLSGGEQQMLAIARALMSEPRYLLLDEPSLGLAPRIVEQIRDLIVRLNEEGTSILLVEQNAAMALSVADHGYVLETGRIVLDKPAAALRADDEVREFYLGLREGETTDVVPRPQALQEAASDGQPEDARRGPPGLQRRTCPPAARCSRCATSSCASAACGRCAASPSTCARTSSSRSSGPTAPASRRSSTACRASTARRRARSSSSVATSRAPRPPRSRARASRACSRTSRCSTPSRCSTT